MEKEKSVSIESDLQIVRPKLFRLGDAEEDALPLECGRSLRSVEIQYETYGVLSERGDNAILILHALSGDAHAAGYHPAESPDSPSAQPARGKPGWWSSMIGPGKAFDTDKYFIVCSNVLGGCSGSTGPRSIDPATGQKYNLSFPVITISDMVSAQHRLMKMLGIKKWLSMSGGSMGGMQALQWAVSYPECVGSIIPIATTSCLSPQSIAFNWVGREAIRRDPAWNNGDYDEKQPAHGLGIARMLGHITYLSEESMGIKFGRDLHERKDFSFNFDRNFKIESYLERQGSNFVGRFDANSYLYITRAMDYFDLSGGNHSNEEKMLQGLMDAFKNTKSPFLVISFSSDWLFPPSQSRLIVKALRRNLIDVSYCEIKSKWGHDSFLIDEGKMTNDEDRIISKVMSPLVSDFLRNRLQESRNA